VFPFGLFEREREREERVERHSMKEREEYFNSGAEAATRLTQKEN